MGKQGFIRLMLAGVGVMLLFLCAACPKKTPPLPLPEPALPRFIDAQAIVTVGFPADGMWHPSGFMAIPGDVLAFAPIGKSKAIGKTSVQVHIGRTVSQFAFTSRSQIVTTAGAIAFRVVPQNLGPYPEKTVEVEIRNLRKRE